MKNPKKDEKKPKESSIKYSYAPYNFIPLNEKIVPAQPLPDFDRYHLDRYTGYIELEVEALTPLYIRDTLNEEEYKKKLEKEKTKDSDKTPFSNPDFFNPGGLIRIPGSSLRGMVRTLVEIVSYGKFHFYEDRRLYFRSFADKCKRLREEYSKKIKPKAGILRKEGLKYYIVPTDFKKIEKEQAKTLIKNAGKQYGYFQIYDNIKIKGEEGYIVVSGDIKTKKYDYFIKKPKDEQKIIPLSDDDIRDYKNDRERKAKIDLLKELEKEKKVPCFFSEYQDTNGNKRVAFGHTLYFRIPYDKTIGDHIPTKLKAFQLDLAEAIFGNEKTHSGRVFFEDLHLIKGEYLNEFHPKILSSPKPTTFQHYLVQTPENLNDHPRNLAHYNDTNKIRGYKLYWHKDAKDKDGKYLWIAKKEDVEKHPTQYTKIKPLKEGAKFKGIIRFENLSSIELGAILFVLELPAGCVHKIGMGKPLGLGSIKISTKLYLSDRKKRYEELFSEWNSLTLENNTEKFKKAFEDYVKKHIGQSDTKSLWENERLKKLKTMLSWTNKPPYQKTEYLELEKFRERRVLPEPEQVLQCYGIIK
ncbi:MAG: TIGR03986 family CRISPR-associated RAMP protein [Thermodesulfovibrio sp.]|nr:TIGR03986 family CRISPR-associated RAMP protein [Thermodesulfovibrio sp.]